MGYLNLYNFNSYCNHLGNVNVVVSDRRLGVDELTYTGTDLGSDLYNDYDVYNSNQTGTDPVKSSVSGNLEVEIQEVNDGIVQYIPSSNVGDIQTYGVDFIGIFEISAMTCGEVVVEAYDATNNVVVASYSISVPGNLQAVMPFSTYNTSSPYNLEFRVYGTQLNGASSSFTINNVVNWVTMPDGEADYYLADVVSATDYYPFGMVMPGRSFTSESYRYGFNGMEKDGEEWTGNAGNQLDFGARIYDSRLGRWLSLDPQASKYAAWSPYHGMMNSPIWIKDPNGEEWDFSNLQITYDKNTQSVKLTGEVTVKYVVLNLTNQAIGIDDIRVQDFVIPYFSFDEYMYLELSGKPNLSSADGTSPIVRYEASNLKVNIELVSVINNVEQIMPDDHVVIIANNIGIEVEDDGIVYDAAGIAMRPGNIAAVLSTHLDNHVTTHEIAHNLGADDWKNEDNALPGYLMSYADDKQGFKLTISDKQDIITQIVFENCYQNANYCEPNGSKEKTREFIKETRIH